MSVITQISVQTKDKNRCNVFVDGEFSFAIYIDLVFKYGLKKGGIIDDVIKSAILDEDTRAYSFSLAVKYLQRGLKTKRQVVDYLKKKGFADKTIFQTIDRLCELDYLNDVEYAKRYIETVSSSAGQRLIAYKLMGKGVKKIDIELAVSDVVVDSKETALKLAEKKLRNQTADKLTLSKVFRYLIGKGFTYEDAEYAISKIKGDD